MMGSDARMVSVAARVALVALMVPLLVVADTSPSEAVEFECAQLPPIAASARSTFSADELAQLWSWGDNYFGQLGNGENRSVELSPISVSTMDSIVSVSAGAYHVLALDDEGTVWSWGYGNHGQLGDGTSGFGAERTVPAPVDGLTDVVQIAAGGDSSFAIKRDGTVWAWGRNNNGQLGDGTLTDRPVPVQVPALTGVTEIASSTTFTLALRPDGRVWSFGRGIYGELGRGSDLNASYPNPGLVQNSSNSSDHLTGVTSIAAGGSHSLAAREDGTARAWGYGVFGQLGNGSTLDRRYPTTVVSASGSGSLSGIVEVSGGGNFSVARASGGSLWAWGHNGSHQLGNTSADLYQTTPVQVSNVSNALLVDTGSNHSIVLRSNGRTSTWGANWDGQIGDGTTNTRSSPFRTPIEQAAPEAVTDLEAIAGERLAYLTWEAPDSLVTQYVVTPYRGGVAQDPIPTGDTETEFVVPNLIEGATYTFEVAGQNCLDVGTAGDRTDPVVPTGVQLNNERFSVEGQRINDRMTVQVNVFNGNLTLDAHDLHLAGTGLDVTVDRTYHSRGSGTGAFGNRWSTTLATDVRLKHVEDGGIMLHGPGGWTAGFARTSSGSFRTPAGVDATLEENPDGTFTLHHHYSGEEHRFAADGTLSVHADRNDNTISYTHDATGRLTSLTDTQGRDLTLDYDTEGRVTQLEDVSGRQWSYDYDGQSNLVTYGDPDGGTTTFDYDGNDRLTRITTPVGRQVEIGYDAVGRVEALSWPLAAGSPTTTLTYDDHQTVVTDPRGNDTTYQFDPVGRTTGVTDALGNAASTDYTSHSNVDRHRRPRGGETDLDYDPRHNLTDVTYPTSAAETYQYNDPDHPHLPSSVRDAQRNRTWFNYDSNGNLVKATNELATDNTVELDRNPDGTMAQSRDPRGPATSYDYDTDGNLTRISPPSPLGSTDLTHDAVSRISTVTDGEGQTTSYAYDPLDRLVEVVYDDGTTLEYAYDGDGNLLTMQDETGTTTMTYGPRNELIDRTTPGGSSVSYGYDAVGNLTSITDDQGTTSYTYNPINLPVEVRPPGGAAISMTYDANYNRTSVSYPNGVQLASTYDDSDRLTKISAVEGTTTLFSYDYRYRVPATGSPDTVLRHSVTDQDGITTRYVYDELNRLVQARTVDTNSQTLTSDAYTYDGAGNRLSHHRDDGTLSVTHHYTYNDANQLVDLSDEEFFYDANGNLTGTNVGMELSYNAAGQTTAIRPRADQGIGETYTYRGAGQAERISNGALDGELLEGDCVPLAGCLDLPDVEVEVLEFAHDQLGVAARSVLDDTQLTTEAYTRDPAGRLLAVQSPAGDRFVLTDGLGSVMGLVDGDGTMVASYRYSPFGETLEADGVAAEANPWRFAGEYLDATGMYKIGQRYYHPGWGRWTQPDPIYDPVDPKLWNPYAYVGNDPINHTDPNGTSPRRVACGVADSLLGFLPLPNVSSDGGSIVAGGLTVAGYGAVVHALGRSLGVGRLAVAAASAPLVAAGVASVAIGVNKLRKHC